MSWSIAEYHFSNITKKPIYSKLGLNSINNLCRVIMKVVIVFVNRFYLAFRLFVPVSFTLVCTDKKITCKLKEI